MRPAQAEILFPDVSRETWERLEEFVGLALKWQRAVNLVSSSSLPAIWERHIFDSLQLARLAPDAVRWADLGSGGGFPGIVVAIARPEISMSLIENDQRKAAFLREASRVLRLSAEIHCERIEAFCVRDDNRSFDVVSARALAPLSRLLELAYPLLKRETIGLFPKGAGLADELTEAGKSWMFQYETVPSMTSAEAGILVVRGAAPRDRNMSHV